jgi:hypothetical protein
MLVMLLRSSSLYSQLPLGLAGLVFPEVDGAFDGGVEGDCRLGGRLDLFGVAGLWIEMARDTDARTVLMLGFFVRARSLGSLSADRLSQGLAVIQRSIQLQPQLGFPGSVKVGVIVRPEFLHCMRRPKKEWQKSEKTEQHV